MRDKAKNYLSIAIFAFFGGIARASLNTEFSFYGTFFGNVIGCFLLAFLTYFFFESKNIAPWLSAGLGTGFVGAFTTFSTFSLDTLKLLNTGQLGTASIYYLGSIVVGFFVAFLGARIGQKIGERIYKEED